MSTELEYYMESDSNHQSSILRLHQRPHASVYRPSYPNLHGGIPQNSPTIYSEPLLSPLDTPISSLFLSATFLGDVRRF